MMFTLLPTLTITVPRLPELMQLISPPNPLLQLIEQVAIQTFPMLLVGQVTLMLSLQKNPPGSLPVAGAPKRVFRCNASASAVVAAVVESLALSVDVTAAFDRNNNKFVVVSARPKHATTIPFFA